MPREKKSWLYELLDLLWFVMKLAFQVRVIEPIRRFEERYISPQARAHIPNGITFFRIAGGILVFPIFYYGYGVSALVLYALSCGTDFVDGRLARRWDTQSELGGILDPAADKIAFWITFGLVVATFYQEPWIWFLISVGTFVYAPYDLIQTYRRFFVDRTMTASKMAKIKTVVLLTSNGLLLGLAVLGPILQPLEYLLLLAAGLGSMVAATWMTIVSARKYYQEHWMASPLT